MSGLPCTSGSKAHTTTPPIGTAKVAMKELEAKTGKKVVTALNAKAVLAESRTAKKLNTKKPKKQ